MVFFSSTEIYDIQKYNEPFLSIFYWTGTFSERNHFERRNSFCFSNVNASKTNEKTAQAVVVEFSLHLAICMGFPSVISNVLIESFSDCYGRRRLLLVPTVALLVAEVIIVVFIHLKVSLYYI